MNNAHNNMDPNRAPVDATASRVIQPSSIDDRFETKKSTSKASELYWDTPKPHSKPSHLEKDLTGRQFGRFTVTGKLKGEKGKWQVRCACGNYSSRRSKAIHNPNNANDCCEVCRELLYLKRDEARRRGHTNITWKDL